MALKAMLPLLHFLIGACLPLVGMNVLTGAELGQNPINASNPSKLLMAAVALVYTFRVFENRRPTVSRDTLLFVLGAYGIYFLGNTIDMFWFAVNATKRTPSIASFLVTPWLLYVIPYLAVKSMLTDPRHIERYLQGIAVSLCWITVVAVLQLNYLFGAIPPLASLYGDVLYKLVESRWGGWGASTNMASDFPLIGWQLRPAASFQEPSVFASYVFLVAAPLFIVLRREHVTFMPRRTIMVCASIVPLLLGLSLSATALVALASLAFYRVLVKFRFSARAMIPVYAALLVILGTTAVLFNEQIGNLVEGSVSLETRFGGFVGSVEQVAQNPWGTGFRFSSESLGQYIPQWGWNAEFDDQQDNQWFVSTFFGMQVAGMIGIVPFCWLLWMVYREVRRIEMHAPVFSRRLLHAYIWALLVSSFAAVQYQEPWFVYGIAIAYLFPQSGVGIANGRIFIRRPCTETERSA